MFVRNCLKSVVACLEGGRVVPGAYKMVCFLNHATKTVYGCIKLHYEAVCEQKVYIQRLVYAGSVFFLRIVIYV